MNLKPENILIDNNNELKITDFGISKIAERKSYSPIKVIENMRYFSPEALNAGDNLSIITFKSDIWSYGIVILELAFGRDTYRNTDIMEIDQEKVKAEFDKRGGYSNEMRDFIARCFTERAEERPSVDDLLSDDWFNDVRFEKENILERVLNQLEIELYDKISIGTGSFGVVYKARYTLTNVSCVCKVIQLEKADDMNRLIKSVEDEIRIMKEYSGKPGIVTIYDYKVLKENAIIIMEYCTEGSLQKYVERERRLREEVNINYQKKEIKSIAFQILVGIYNLRGIVHRDIKPENLLIDSYGNVKLIDYGLAKDGNGFAQLTLAGSSRYFAPEVRNGISQSHKSDIWSFGVVIMELAFRKNTLEVRKLYSFNSESIITFFNENKEYSNEMALFVSKCFERKVEKRVSVKVLLKEKWMNDVDIRKFAPIIKSGNNN